MPPVKIVKKVSLRKSPVITRKFGEFLRNPNVTPETMAEKVVKHEVITTVVDLPKFSGEPDTIDINHFIQRVNTFIANKGIVDEKLKIEAFKQNIDAVKGLAKQVIIYSQLEEINKYEDYVKAFKRHFTKQSDRDPLRAMVKCLGIRIGPGESQTELISRLDSCAKDMAKIFEGTEWTLQNSPTNISLQNTTRIIMLEHVIRSNKGISEERLYKDLKVTVPLGEGDCMIKRYAETNPSHNPYVMLVRAPPQSLQPQRQSRAQHRGIEHVPFRPRSSSRPRNMIECFRCQKSGHTSKQCCSNVICNNCQYQGHMEAHCRNSPWCSYRKVRGRRTQDCRGRRSQNLQSGQDPQ